MHTARDPSLPALFHPDALADYFVAERQPEMVCEMCEDYRAAAGIDLAHDRASRAAGVKVQCPMLVLLGEKGKIGAWFRICPNQVIRARESAGL